MVHPLHDPGPLKGLVEPDFPMGAQNLGCILHVVLLAVDRVQLGNFLSQDLVFDRTGRDQDVGVEVLFVDHLVVLVPGSRSVDRHVGHHPVMVGDVPGKVLGQFDRVFFRDAVRKCHLKFPGRHGVSPLVVVFDSVPKRLTGHTCPDHLSLSDHTLFSGVIEGHILPQVMEFFTSAIGRSGNGRTSVASLQSLRAKVIKRSGRRQVIPPEDAHL